MARPRTKMNLYLNKKRGEKIKNFVPINSFTSTQLSCCKSEGVWYC